MSKLTDFYEHKASFQKNDQGEGNEWNLLEDQLLKEELLPEMIQQLKTVLSKVKSPIMFSGTYNPDGRLSMSVTCNFMVTSISTEPPEITIPPHLIPEPPSTSDESTRKRAESVGFSVEFPDGVVIREKKAVDTFIKALRKIGLGRIASHQNCPMHVGHQLVGTVERIDLPHAQHLVDGYYIYTKLSNDAKIADLVKLSKLFDLGLKITFV